MSQLNDLGPSDADSLPSATNGSQLAGETLTEYIIPKRIGLSDMDSIRYMAFGSLFILMVDSCLFPLDTIKTIIMAERSKQLHKQNMFKMVFRIAKHEGILRFWRGLMPSVAGSFPGQAMYYLAYESTQELAQRAFPNDTSSTSIFVKGFIAGASAEVAGGLFYVPADIIAQRLQVQSINGFVHNKRLYHGPLDVFRKVLRNDGIRGFYRGYFAYVGAYAPASAVQWGSYELFKGILFRAATLLEIQANNGNAVPYKENMVNGLSGGLASICAIAANNPLEILRIRTQLLESQNKRDAECIRKGYLSFAATIWKEEGWRAFYRGLRIRMLVTVPSAIVAMSGYEQIKTWSAQ
eukprot:jgi/Hompol1/5497/HPOL_000199-RA